MNKLYNSISGLVCSSFYFIYFKRVFGLSLELDLDSSPALPQAPSTLIRMLRAGFLKAFKHFMSQLDLVRFPKMLLIDFCAALNHVTELGLWALFALSKMGLIKLPSLVLFIKRLWGTQILLRG